MFVRQNVIKFCVWMILTLLFTYYLIVEARKKRNYFLAESLYKCIVLDIQKNNKVGGSKG